MYSSYDVTWITALAEINIPAQNIKYDDSMDNFPVKVMTPPVAYRTLGAHRSFRVLLLMS